MIALFRRRSRPLDCRQVAAMLQPFLDGELAPRWRDEVERHLEDCRRCGLEAEIYRDIKAALRRGAPPPPATSVELLRQFVNQLEAGTVGDPGAARDGWP